MSEAEKHDPGGPLGGLYWRDEILQVMYWMTGEGFGREFAPADLQKFLSADEAMLVETLGRMVSDGLLARAEEGKYALTALGQQEGGRRFADEFEEMLKPGHFECDAPDCDCHNPEATGEACKHHGAAHMT